MVQVGFRCKEDLRCMASSDENRACGLVLTEEPLQAASKENQWS